jgi:hypothetical protein
MAAAGRRSLRRLSDHGAHPRCPLDDQGELDSGVLLFLAVGLLVLAIPLGLLIHENSRPRPYVPPQAFGSTISAAPASPSASAPTEVLGSSDDSPSSTLSSSTATTTARAIPPVAQPETRTIVDSVDGLTVILPTGYEALTKSDDVINELKAAASVDPQVASMLPQSLALFAKGGGIFALKPAEIGFTDDVTIVATPVAPRDPADIIQAFPELSAALTAHGATIRAHSIDTIANHRALRILATTEVGGYTAEITEAIFINKGKDYFTTISQDAAHPDPADVNEILSSLRLS